MSILKSRGRACCSCCGLITWSSPSSDKGLNLVREPASSRSTFLLDHLSLDRCHLIFSIQVQVAGGLRSCLHVSIILQLLFLEILV